MLTGNGQIEALLTLSDYLSFVTIYLAGSALGFEANRISVHQVLGVKTDRDGSSGRPRTRDYIRYATSK